MSEIGLGQDSSRSTLLLEAKAASRRAAIDGGVPSSYHGDCRRADCYCCSSNGRAAAAAAEAGWTPAEHAEQVRRAVESVFSTYLLASAHSLRIIDAPLAGQAPILSETATLTRTALLIHALKVRSTLSRQTLLLLALLLVRLLLIRLPRLRRQTSRPRMMK